MSEHPVQIVISDDCSRSRASVFFRAILSIPHFIWLLLWSAVALLAAVANWLATLVRGRSPRSLHRFLAAYVKYVTQFYAYLHLSANPYPSFDAPDGYPIDLKIAPAARQSRWTVVLRGLLLLPAALIAAALIGDPIGGFNSGRGSFSYSSFGILPIVALLGWFAIIARRSMPRGLRDAAAYALAYGAQFWAYALLLTDRYPDSDPQALPGLPVREDPISVRLDDELRRSRLTVFFRLLLAFPHLLWLSLWTVLALLTALASWIATLLAGRSPQLLHGFLARYLRYAIHVYAFLYLIANPFPGFVGAVGSYPLELRVAERRRQNRWKTAFRSILVIPAWALAAAYGTLVSLVALLGWFSSLARGRMPHGLRNAGALGLRYQAQTLGYLLLLTDSYPYGGPARDEGAARDAARGSQPAGGAVAPATPAAGSPAVLPDLGLS